MKSLLLLLFPTLLFSQNVNKQINSIAAMADTMQLSRPLTFSNIDSVKLSKREIFTNLNNWVSKTFPAIALTFQMRDSVQGKIILTNIESNASSHLTFQLTIDIRDGKYRCIMDNYIYEEDGKMTLEELENSKVFYMGKDRKTYVTYLRVVCKEESEKYFELMSAEVRKQENF